MRSLGRTVIETDEPILQEGTSPDISRIHAERYARFCDLICMRPKKGKTEHKNISYSTRAQDMS